MNTTLLIIYRIMLASLFAGWTWAAVAYAQAFRITRRRLYRERAITWLAIVGVYATLVIVITSLGSPLSVLPFLFPAIYPFGRCFADAPDKKMPEYRSPLDIMVFRPAMAPTAQDAGLFVPAAPPERTASWLPLAITVGVLAGSVLLMALLA